MSAQKQICKCEYCGREFLPRRWAIAKYCSSKCRLLTWYAHHKDNTEFKKSRVDYRREFRRTHEEYRQYDSAQVKKYRDKHMLVQTLYFGAMTCAICGNRGLMYAKVNVNRKTRINSFACIWFMHHSKAGYAGSCILPGSTAYSLFADVIQRMISFADASYGSYVNVARRGLA